MATTQSGSFRASLLDRLGARLGQLEPQESKAQDSKERKDPKDRELANEVRERQEEESQEDVEGPLDSVHERGASVAHARREDLGQERPEETADTDLEAGDEDEDDRDREDASNVAGAPDEEHAGNDVGDRHDDETAEDQNPATDALDQEERPERRDKVPRSHADRGKQLRIVATETGGLEDARRKVDDGVDTRELQGNGKHEANQHELGVRGEEQDVRARSLSFSTHAHDRFAAD